MNEPIIVCLCGSTKFKQEFIDANFRETMKGKIVLSVGFFRHTDKELHHLTREEGRSLDRLHLQKIDLAHEILILDVGGYMGNGTNRELEYARIHHKTIRFLSLEEANE